MFNCLYVYVYLFVYVSFYSAYNYFPIIEELVLIRTVRIYYCEEGITVCMHVWVIWHFTQTQGVPCRNALAVYTIHGLSACISKQVMVRKVPREKAGKHTARTNKKDTPLCWTRVPSLPVFGCLVGSPVACSPCSLTAAVSEQTADVRLWIVATGLSTLPHFHVCTNCSGGGLSKCR